MNLSTAVTTLLVFVNRGSQRFIVTVYGFFSSLALLPLLVFAARDARDARAGAIMAAWFFAVGAALVWGYGACGGITLMQEARALRMPSTGRAVFSALLVLFVATILFPAILLGWYSGNFVLFLAALSFAAFVALFYAMLPRILSFFVVPAFVLGHSAAPALALGDPQTAAILIVAAASLGALNAARWWQLQRQRQRRITWGSPMLTSMHRPLSFNPFPPSAGTTIDKSAMPAIARIKVSVSGLGSTTPIRAMRALLGSSFAPQNWRQRAARIAVGLAGMVLVAVFLTLFLGGAKEMFLPWLGLVACIMVLTVFRARLQFMFRHGGGELTELALLPGWEDARRARRTLLTAAFQPLLAWTFGLSLLMVLLAYGLNVQAQAYLMIVGVAIGVGSTSVAFCMRALADMRSSIAIVAPVVVLAMTLLATSAALLPASVGYPLDIKAMLRLDLFWLTVVALMSLLTLHAYRRFVARPHPFLAE